MKLYAFQPKGHGEFSFFVCAENEESARIFVDEYIRKHYRVDDGHYIDDRYISGWGTDYYQLTELNPGEVITNDND